jgi:hypothetical protein
MTRWFLFPLVLSACVGSSAEEPNDVASAARKLAVEECAHRVRCDGVRFSRFFESVAQCESRMTIHFGVMLASPHTNLTTAWAASCANALAADACSDERPSACKLIAGRGGVGASCYSGSDCVESLCVFRADPVSLGSPRCGTCEARPATSAAPPPPAPLVTTGGACDATRKCDTNFDDCVDGVCTPQQFAKVGEVCGRIAGGVRIHCPATSTCSDRNGFNEMGRCIPDAADGQACNVDIGPGCITPARCVLGVCTLPDVAACQSAP